MSTEDSFGQWLKQRRKALDLTRQALAQQVGCAVITLQKIEAGERRPSREMAERLAECLGIASKDRSAFIEFARAGSGTQGRLARARWVRSRRPPSNLPVSLTPLMGREQDVAVLRRRLLDDGVRLLTLLGPPGIGKTRLAIQVAGEVLYEFEDGVCFVSLAPVSAPNLVAAAIAEALGVKDIGDMPLARRLWLHLRDKHLLLVLDNFEHVLDAGPLVADLLVSCPWLSVLVTSRAPLRVRGERQFPVQPLALPAVGVSAKVAPTELLGYSAIALFVECAQAVRPDFALTNANAVAVPAICTRLDGLPLAIELMAPRIKLLPVRVLLDKLGGLLLLNTDGLRDLEPRHKTLRRAIGWSYDLLSPAEKTLFARLGVFVGSFTLEAAEAICATPSPLSALADVASLLDKNLLRRETGKNGELRLGMLETIREYALEWLQASGEVEAIRRRHAEYFLRLAEEAQPHLHDAEQLIWLARLDAEHDNLRAALAWCLSDTGDGETALRLVTALGWFWFHRNYYVEGSRWVEAALARNPTAPTVWRVPALFQASMLAIGLSDLERVLARGQEALALARAQGDWRWASCSLGPLGIHYWVMGNLKQTVTLWMEGLALARQVGDPWLVAGHLSHLAAIHDDPAEIAAMCEEALTLSRQLGDRWVMTETLWAFGRGAQLQGDGVKALTALEEALAVARELGDKRQIMLLLQCLARLELDQGRHEQATTYARECLEVARQAGTVELITSAFQDLGEIAHRRGDMVGAARHFCDGLASAQDTGHRPAIAPGLAAMAALAAERSQDTRAARLFGAAEALYETLGITLEADQATGYGRHLIAARARRLESAFAAAWAEGRAMTPEQAIAYALMHDRESGA